MYIEQGLLVVGTIVLVPINWAVLLRPYLARFAFALLSTTDIEGTDGLASDNSSFGASTSSHFSTGREVVTDVVIDGGKDEYC